MQRLVQTMQLHVRMWRLQRQEQQQQQQDLGLGPTVRVHLGCKMCSWHACSLILHQTQHKARQTHPQQQR
jgi:hypothetical protein